MLELRKKGNKHWLLIDEEIGEFSPSKFTINRLNNVINIVYFNNLKSKEYNVSDCYIFDIDDTSGFNTSDGVAFMDKLEELNCPCFQKDETIIIGGVIDISGKLDKVSTAGVERAYIINADGSQGTKATSEFGGDETTSSIQTKRPLKTVNGESLEGSGNIQIDYNDLDNKPPPFPPSSIISKFIFNEIPSGIIDGINSIFNTNFLLVPDTEVVFINGQKQKKPDDYNISGQTITFTFSPGVSESVVINYIKQ